MSASLLAFLLIQVNLQRLGHELRSASAWWLGVAIATYFVIVLASSWRWALMLTAQGIKVPRRLLVRSYLVATFFNNFLPSNIGGDVVRIRDTAAPAGSKTAATTIVLLDRAIGLIGLLIVATAGISALGGAPGPLGRLRPQALWLACAAAIGLFMAAVMFPGRALAMLSPLRAFNREWVDTRLVQIADMLRRLRRQPWSVVNSVFGAVVVQALLVGFHVAIASSLHLPIPVMHLAVAVPLSFVVQLLPVSINGIGVREATFAYYFAGLGLRLESALMFSFLSTSTILLFSLSGAAAYFIPPRALTGS